MLSFIREFSRTRLCWLLLLLTGIGMEGCGLYFQYSLRLDPCVYCVYERALIMCFVIIGLTGFLFPGFTLFRILYSLGLLASSGYGLYVAFQHYQSSISTGFGSVCKLTAEFPSFMPLDSWLPWLFAPKGQCGPLDWSFMGFSMPEWILLIFFCGALAGLLLLLSQFKRPKRETYERYYR